MYEQTEKRAAQGIEKLDKEDRLSLVHKKIRCYHALGEWRQVLSLTRYLWSKADIYRPKVAVMGAQAAWQMGEWADLEIFCKVIGENTVSGKYVRY